VASGYDLSNRHPFRLMQGRLGTYDRYSYSDRTVDPQIEGITD
jgi:hypothetical protein